MLSKNSVCIHTAIFLSKQHSICIILLSKKAVEAIFLKTENGIYCQNINSNFHILIDHKQ